MPNTVCAITMVTLTSLAYFLIYIIDVRSYMALNSPSDCQTLGCSNLLLFACCHGNPHLCITQTPSWSWLRLYVMWATFSCVAMVTCKLYHVQNSFPFPHSVAWFQLQSLNWCQNPECNTCGIVLVNFSVAVDKSNFLLVKFSGNWMTDFWSLNKYSNLSFVTHTVFVKTHGMFEINF